MPLLAAHRGAMVEAPENTRAAFDKAVSYPIDGIEFDVQITKDGMPVIFHDDSLKKILNTSRTISDYTYEELSGFDWGSWFSKEFSGEKIPTLEEVLKSYGEKTGLFIEIKSAPDRKKVLLYSKLPRLVTQQIRQFIPHEYMNRIFILSFDQDLLKSAYAHDPGLNYVLNLDFPIIDPDDLNLDFDMLDGCCLAFKKLSSKFVSFYRDRGKRVMTYSCNTPEMIYRAFSLNIDVIMTDDPGGVYDFFLTEKSKEH